MVFIPFGLEDLIEVFDMDLAMVEDPADEDLVFISVYRA